MYHKTSSFSEMQIILEKKIPKIIKRNYKQQSELKKRERKESKVPPSYKTHKILIRSKGDRRLPK